MKTFPASERIATATATVVPTRAMPTAACEYTSTHRATAPTIRAGAPSTAGGRRLDDGAHGRGPTMTSDDDRPGPP